MNRKALFLLAMFVCPALPAEAQTAEDAAPAEATKPTDPTSPVDPTDQALTIATEALALYDKKEFAQALARFDEAARLAEIPTAELHAARCLVELGRWIEADARYERITRTVMPSTASPKWFEAKANAEKERAELLTKIPSVTAVILGAEGLEKIIEVDGKPLRLGVSVARVEIGKHTVTVKIGERTQSQSTDLVAGNRKALTFDFKPAAIVPPVGGPTGPGPTGVGSKSQEEPGTSPLMAVGATALGLGGAGLIVWGVTAGAVISGSSSCSSATAGESVCREGEDVDELNTLQLTSTVAFYAGLGLAVAGGTMLTVWAVTDDKSAETTTVSVGPTGWALTYRFH